MYFAIPSETLKKLHREIQRKITMSKLKSNSKRKFTQLKWRQERGNGRNKKYREKEEKTNNKIVDLSQSILIITLNTLNVKNLNTLIKLLLRQIL